MESNIREAVDEKLFNQNSEVQKIEQLLTSKITKQNEENRKNGTAPEVIIDEKFGDSYHNFGMEWTDDYIAFYIDGIRYYTYDCTTLEAADVFDQYSTIVFSAFSDRGYTGLPVPDEHKVSYNYVDWIRVWQKDEPGYGINIK